MLELLEKWQTLILAVLGGLGVLVMAFLYMRFTPRKEFIKHKAATATQLTEYKNEMLEQLSEVKRSVTDDVQELERRLEKVPTTEDLHELELKIGRLNTNIESVKPGLNNVQKLTDLLMENELRGNRSGD